MSTETATSLLEVISAAAIIAGCVMVAGVGVALIIGGLLGILFSVRVAA